MNRIVWGLLLLVLLPSGAFAADEAHKEHFDEVLSMEMDELAIDAERVLKEKYSEHDWSQYNFPEFVHNSRAVEVAYKVAMVSEDLLGKTDPNAADQGLPCDCFCELRGHQSLLACFLRGGDMEKGFSSHAAECHVCVAQALSAFLWHDSGAGRKDILYGLKIKFVSTSPESSSDSGLSDIEQRGEIIGVEHKLSDRGLGRGMDSRPEDAYMP